MLTDDELVSFEKDKAVQDNSSNRGCASIAA
jgi:hypothetical protein